MQDQKLDNLLNLALDSTMEEREKSLNLNIGYNEELRLWDVIVKYSGGISGLEGEGITVTPLLGGYAVVTLPESQLVAYSARPQVEFVEKPKRLFFEVYQAKVASCIRSVQIEQEGLSGKGVLVGIVDSGVDYRHPDFCNEDGTTRILKYWDQSVKGNPPKGYYIGTEYTKEQIDEALFLTEEEGRRLVPGRDASGHGTAVLGIAAGNGRGSKGINQGVAYESELLVVKMGLPRENSFPRTIELIQGIDYLIRQAQELGRPIAINISFGNNYGSHKGDSLLETYIENASNVGRTVICVGTGNNGNDKLHTAGRVAQGERKEIEFGISEYETGLNIQLWKSYADQMEIYIENPSGERVGPLYEVLGAQRNRMGDTELLAYYGKPAPFQVTQEIYIDFLPIGTYLDSGVWKIILRGREIKEGDFYMWLPGGNVLNINTGFFLPRALGTLTIPSTAGRVISVGAYDSRLNAYADFSGRGSSFLPFRKPDLAAPGVDITAPRAGGGYIQVTGTSFATPFVTGGAVLLMEWGIIEGNDAFLFGEKVKAYLRRGAKALPGYDRYPNPEIGYGVLCVRNSIPE